MKARPLVTLVLPWKGSMVMYAAGLIADEAVSDPTGTRVLMTALPGKLGECAEIHE